MPKEEEIDTSLDLDKDDTVFAEDQVGTQDKDGDDLEAVNDEIVVEIQPEPQPVVVTTASKDWFVISDAPPDIQL